MLRWPAVVVPLLAIACALTAAAPARAETLVVESHASPDTARALVTDLRRELGALDPSIADGRAARRLRATVLVGEVAALSLPASFVEDVERGHRAWIKGQFAGAIGTLAPLVTQALAAPLALVGSPALAASAHKAMADLALAYQRSGAAADARATMAELIRTFPERPLTRAIHGPLGMELFEATHAELERAAAATFSLRGDPAASYWLNERKLAAGDTVTVAPGRYRLLVRAGDAARLAALELVAGSTLDVHFDPQVAATLQLDGDLAVLAAAPTSTTRHVVAQLAAALAPIDLVHLHARDAGTVEATWTAADGTARAAALSTSDQAAAVARYLLRGERDARIAILEPAGAATATPAPRAAPRDDATSHGSLSPWKWISAALGVAGAGVGAYLFSIHDTCAGDVLPSGMCNRLHDTRTPGLAIGAGGGALLITAAVMFIVDARRAPDAPRKVAPRVALTRGGALAGLAGSF